MLAGFGALRQGAGKDFNPRLGVAVERAGVAVPEAFFTARA